MTSQVQESLQKEQISRSEEQRAHADMLKELQNLLTSERDKSQVLKAKVAEDDAL